MLHLYRIHTGVYLGLNKHFEEDGVNNCYVNVLPNFVGQDGSSAFVKEKIRGKTTTKQLNYYNSLAAILSQCQFN